MAGFDDIERNDVEAALDYLRAEAKREGFVEAELVGMLAMMQDDFPASLDRFFRLLEREKIDVRGEFE